MQNIYAFLQSLMIILNLNEIILPRRYYYSNIHPKEIFIWQAFCAIFTAAFTSATTQEVCFHILGTSSSVILCVRWINDRFCHQRQTMTEVACSLQQKTFPFVTFRFSSIMIWFTSRHWLNIVLCNFWNCSVCFNIIGYLRKISIL